MKKPQLKTWGIFLLCGWIIYAIEKVSVGLLEDGVSETSWWKIALYFLVALMTGLATEFKMQRDALRRREAALEQRIDYMVGEKIGLWNAAKKLHDGGAKAEAIWLKEIAVASADNAKLKLQIGAINKRHDMANQNVRLTQEQLAKANAEIIRLKGTC